MEELRKAEEEEAKLPSGFDLGSQVEQGARDFIEGTGHNNIQSLHVS